MATKMERAPQKFTGNTYRTGLQPSGHDVEPVHTAKVTAQNVREAGRLMCKAMAFPNDVMLHVALVKTAGEDQ